MKNQMQIFGLFLLSFLFVNTQMMAQAGWKIVSNSNAPVVSGKAYYLQVAENDKFLKYESRSYGINLKWGKTKSPNISFKKPGRSRQIRCGDRVAIYVKGGGYLAYKKRKYGINLTWSKKPVYQWEIRSVDNKKGAVIKPNTPVGLVNIVENKNKGDFMVYCRRKNMPVVNLGWYNDCTGGSRLPGKLNKYRKEIEFAMKHKEKLLLLL